MKTILVVTLIVVLLLVAGFALYFLRPDPPPVKQSNKLSVDVASTLLKENQRSIALLENQSLEEALFLLGSLSRRYPNEPSLIQNEIVALVVAIDQKQKGDGGERAELIAKGRDRVSALMELQPESTSALRLAARLEQQDEQYGMAIDQLRRAVEKNPDDVIVVYELYGAEQKAAATAGEETDSGMETLKTAYELAPENSWVTLKLFEELVSAGRWGELKPVAENLKSLVEPIAAGVGRRNRISLEEYFSQLLEALEGENPAIAMRYARVLANVIRPEELAQSDRRSLEKHPFEFIVPRFSDELLARFPDEVLAPFPFVDAPFEFQRYALVSEPFGEILDLRTGDVNLDGIQDVVTLHANNVVLWLKRTDDDTWNPRALFEPVAGVRRLLLIDLDHDGDATRESTIQDAPCYTADLDFVLYGASGIHLYRNLSQPVDGKLEISVEPVTDSTPASFEASVRMVQPMDFDLDGDLDLVTIDENGAFTFAVQHGAFEFVDQTDRVMLPESDLQPKRVFVADLDRDVDLDLVVAGMGPNLVVGYFENLRHGEMRWREIEALDGIETSSIAALTVSDFNADARWDLGVVTDKQLCIALQVPSGNGSTFAATEPVPLEAKVSSAEFRDLNNDGWEDVLGVDDEQELTIWIGQGNGRFIRSDVDGNAADLSNLADRFALGEVTDDFSTDVICIDSGELTVLRTNEFEGTHAIKITLLDQQEKADAISESGRVNYYGLGSLIEVKAGEVYVPRIVGEQTTVIGYGATPEPEAVRMLWTNGIPQNLLKPGPHNFFCEKQTLKGSCPYLYAWNGERFEFVTDLLWAAPIGLQFAEGIIAPTRADEYLLIPSEFIAEQDGRYEFRITEELWEAAYFDQVELLAIDHPVELEIYSNEKVASSDSTEFKIHPVTRKRKPVAIMNHHGRDLLPELTERDGVFAKPFGRKYFQGVVEEHFLEIDLGDVTSEAIKLFLTGWIYPTDTSLNVQLGQNTNAPKAFPPRLEVLDESGEWITAIPMMGFPGGKTKTIVVDLTGRFPSEQRRVRIVTSAELYWDEIFFTVDEADTDMNMSKAEMTEAELRYRGVSREIIDPGFGPERYDYHNVNNSHAWPPMSGPMTDYGDVTELLRETDDHFVVMGASDEIAIRFKAPDSPPPGWTRSFVMHNVGYDKDADLNTLYGDSTLPYPRYGEPLYPHPEKPSLQLPSAGRNQPRRAFWRSVRDFSASRATERRP